MLRQLTFFIILTFMATVCYSKNLTQISVMTFNIENGGTQMDFNKVVEAVNKSGADVVGIQEAWGHTTNLAKALHWKYVDITQHIVSRFPLWVPVNADHRYLFIELSPGKVVAMANMHLPDEPYGPDIIKQGALMSEVVAKEKKVRLFFALSFANKLFALEKTGIPVFLTGDFNSPSHLDWIQSIVKIRPDHHYAMPWPVTRTLTQNGLTDSFRAIYPDPVKTPGYTWPAGRPFLQHTYDGFNPSAEDLPERLDFIFSGNAHVIESHNIGEPGNTLADIFVSPWPSDHRAVVSRFMVMPVKLPKGKYIKPADLYANTLGKPFIRVSKTDKRIEIIWKNAPGNRYDYIRIAPVGSNKLAWGEAVRLYTHAKINGSIQYDARNAKGNWLAWNKGEEGRWPMMAGKYNVELMLDDGNTILASTQMTIH